MRRNCFLLIFVLVVPLLMGFTSARVVTQDDGQQVVLFPDGSWKEFRGNLRPQNQLQRFVVGSDDAYGVWYSPDSWTVPSAMGSPEYDLAFVHMSKGAYAYVLYGKEKLTLESLRDYAWYNARRVIDESKISYDKQLEINGQQVLCLKIEGWYYGEPEAPLVYYGYYYTGDMGSIQFVVYTTESLFQSLQQEIKALLNGFIVMPK